MEAVVGTSRTSAERLINQAGYKVNERYFDGSPHAERYGDLKWIGEQIDLLPIGMQNQVKEKYHSIYQELAGDPKQRYRSNLWLVRVVKKHKATGEGVF